MAQQQPEPPKNFNVGIQGILESNRGVNFNIQVTADNVLDAVDKGKAELLKLLKNAGLGVLAPVVASPAAGVDPNTPAL